MKAIVQDTYGSPDDVLRLREVDKPLVRDDEVLVRVRAASMHPDVWHVVTGWPLALRLGAGVRKPKTPVPGTDLAGLVESVGSDVTRFKIGDEVFGESQRGRGGPWRNGGTFAEYAAVPQDVLALKPTNISFEQAAAVPTSGTIALDNLCGAGKLQSGDNILINGAGGCVGAFAVQIAKARGARVTGVDTAKKAELIRSLGADDVIDYTAEDFTQRGERYDLILDVASTLTLSACRRALTPTGIYVLIGHDHYGNATGGILGSLPRMARIMARSPFDSHVPKPALRFPSKQATMEVLRELLESGKLTPVIDRTFPLSEVAGAMRYLQEGSALGKIIVTP